MLISFNKKLAKNIVSKVYKNVKDISVNSFSNLPLTSKKDVVSKDIYGKYFNHKLPSVVYQSSGTTNTPSFWFRDLKEEEDVIKFHEEIFKEELEISKRDKVLVLNCFSLGMWIAGLYTHSAILGLSKLKYNITLASCGIEKDDSYNVLNKISGKYDTVVIFGYPGFLTMLFSYLLTRKLKTKVKKVCVVTGGDKYDKEWKKQISLSIKKIFLVKSIYINGIYGSAEMGLIGFETTLSKKVKSLYENNANFKKIIESDIKTVSEPFICEISSKRFISEIHNNILFLSKDGVIPFLRYKTNDIVSIVDSEVLKKYNIYKKPDKEIIFVFGRSDVMLTYYGINLYVDMITSIIPSKMNSSIPYKSMVLYKSKIVTGEKLFLKFGINRKIKITDNEKVSFKNSLISKLRKISKEYRKLSDTLGPRVEPVIQFLPSDSKLFERLMNQQDPILKNRIIFSEGKKPKKSI